MLNKIGWRLRRDASPRPASEDGFEGSVDRLTRQSVKGWVLELGSDWPVHVRAMLDGECLAEGQADEVRPDVAQHMGSSGRHGFKLTFDEIESSSLPRVEVRVEGERHSGALPVKHKAIQRRGSRYQDFRGDGEGSSQSHKKLKGLRLEELGDGDRPLQGKSVLDIGCNEGFFCLKSLELGAERVVGLDKSKRCIESARESFPEATFIQGSWWNIPDERFDVILFLSSIHYESDQKLLLERLKHHLSPGGTLVLECGVANDPGVRAWQTVERGDGVFRYPTRDLLIHDLLSGYSVRRVSRSAQQKGDPIPRFVYHCTPKKATAILVAGDSKSGKSNLSFDFSRREIPTFSTDMLLSRLVNTQRYAWSPLAEAVSKKFKGQKGGPLNLGHVGNYIVKHDFADALADIVVAEAPVEAELFSIEGQILVHPEVLQAVVNRLHEAGVRPWVMRPA